MYGPRPTPSSESLNDLRRPESEASTPTFADYGNGGAGYEMYPAWVNARQVPISKEYVILLAASRFCADKLMTHRRPFSAFREIEDIFHDLYQKFGFQRDNMRNQVCLLAGARSTSTLALTPLCSTTSCNSRALRRCSPREG